VMTIRRVFALLLLASIWAVSPTDAQGVGAKITEKAKARVEEKRDKAIDKVLDKVECILTDKDCIAKAKKDGKQVVLTDDKGKVLPGQDTSSVKPKTQVAQAGAPVADSTAAKPPTDAPS